MKVELGTKFENHNGIIQNILNEPINAVAIITSKAGSIRSNHYHKLNDHHLYILSGSLEYYERDLDENGKDIKPTIYKSGDMFYTGPMKVHKVVFLEDCVMLSLGKNIKTHEAHEADLVRENF
jgi:quercetin dioxygenase-like cupin family protein